MAAPTLQQIREALADSLAALKDSAQVSAYRLSSPTYPTVFVVGPEEIDYHKTMQSGIGGFPMTVMALTGNASDIGAQQTLDELVSATGKKSVKAALEADTTLGGVVDSLIVRSCSGYRLYGASHNETGYVLGAQWSVDIQARGA